MKRLDRLTSILLQLQSKKIVKAQMLAEKYEVSLRTIYRDMLSLQEAGVPIGAQEGIGYFLVDGYHLPPVMFTDQEANALLMGEKLTAQLTDSVVKKNFEEAMDKIRSVLPDASSDKLNTLSDNMSILRNTNSEASNPVLSEIQTALTQKKSLNLKYYSNYKGEVSEREVEPIGLVFYSDAWHLMAWCLMRKDYRDFRTDRIGKIRISDNAYDRDKHPGLQEHLDSLIDRFTLTEVIVRFKKDVIRFTGNDKYNHGYVDEKDLGDMVEMKFLTPSLDFTARWLLMFDDSVDVISPDALKSHISDLVKLLQKKYLK